MRFNHTHDDRQFGRENPREGRWPGHEHARDRGYGEQNRCGPSDFRRGAGDLGRRMQRPSRGEGGGRERFFEQGDLRFVVLKLIAEKPSYGYEIIKAIEDRLAGAYAPSPGVVYPTLTLLEELGYIKVQETDGPRKLFAITAEGEVALEQNLKTVEAIFGRMAEIHARHVGHQAPLVVRAWQNLTTAMNLRVAQGPRAQEQIEAIAAILYGAAKAIESK